jgi:NAD(P)-dependent dehydrogenase (short-subunit alcohol dehydrogenase family)
MNLRNKIAVVFGGTGGVGEGIVKVFLEHGAIVIVPTRSTIKGERLKEYIGEELSKNLITRVGSVNNEQNALDFSDYLSKEFGQIDITSVSIGSWHQGFAIKDYPISSWNRILNDNLTAHFLAIKTLIPLLNKDDGHYFHINGFSSEETYPNAGPVAMASAAQKSLILTLAEEVKSTGINIYELILGPMKTRDRIKHGHGKDNWYFPVEIGEYIVEQFLKEDKRDVIHRLIGKN